MHRFFYFPLNLLLGLYNAYYAPSPLSTGMRFVIACLPALYNKKWMVSLSHDKLVELAFLRSSQYPDVPKAPEGVAISTTDEFDDLARETGAEWHFYLIRPTSPAAGTESTGSNSFMLYLHGGAYVSTAQPPHFQFLYDLCQRSGVTILLPAYPRPPHSKVSYTEVVGTLGKIVERIRSERSKEGQINRLSGAGEACMAARRSSSFVIAGDSAGGGMTMCLVLWLIKHEREVLLPNLILLNAPWLDVSLSSSELAKYDKIVSPIQMTKVRPLKWRTRDAWIHQDPWLSIPFVRLAGQYWAGSPAALRNPLASPAFLTSTDLETMNRSKMRVAIFQGEADLTCPDTLAFVQRLRDARIPLDFIFKAGVPHVYPLFPKNIPEAEEARTMMANLIRNRQ